MVVLAGSGDAYRKDADEKGEAAEGKGKGGKGGRGRKGRTGPSGRRGAGVGVGGAAGPRPVTGSKLDPNVSTVAFAVPRAAVAATVQRRRV